MNKVWFRTQPPLSHFADFFESQDWADRLAVGIRWRARTQGPLNRSRTLEKFVSALRADDVGFFSYKMGGAGSGLSSSGRHDDDSGSYMFQFSTDEPVGADRVEMWFAEDSFIGASSSDLSLYRSGHEANQKTPERPWVPNPRWLISDPPAGWPNLVAYPAQLIWLSTNHQGNKTVMSRFTGTQELLEQASIIRLQLWDDKDTPEAIERSQDAFIEACLSAISDE